MAGPYALEWHAVRYDLFSSGATTVDLLYVTQDDFLDLRK
jgi:hypothetical protein